MGKAAGVSPYIAKHMVEGTFATLGKQGMTLADSLMGQEKKVAGDPLDFVTFLGFRSAKPIGFGSRPVSEFYDLVDDVTKAKQTIDDLKKKGAYDAVFDVMQKHPNVAMYKTVNEAKGRISRLREYRRKVMAADGMSPQDRKEILFDIDTMATQLAGTTTMSVRDFLTDQGSNSNQ
jgi:hypothetical protein